VLQYQQVVGGRGRICYVVDDEKIGEGGNRRKWWVRPHFNKNNELGTFVVARYTSFHTGQKCFKLCPTSNKRDLSCWRKWSVPQQAAPV
jgi:hypothetical protein